MKKLFASALGLLTFFVGSSFAQIVRFEFPPTVSSTQDAEVVTDLTDAPFLLTVENGAPTLRSIGEGGVLNRTDVVQSATYPASSPLVLARRPGWKPLIAYWSVAGSQARFVALKPNANGFAAHDLFEIPVDRTTFSPPTWVFPTGRFGYLVVWAQDSSLKTRWIYHDGTTRSAGEVSASADVRSVEYFEPGQWDSTFGTLVVREKNGPRVRCRSFDVDEAGIEGELTWLDEIDSGEAISISVAYRSSTSGYWIGVSHGRRLSGAFVEGGAVVSAFRRDFPEPVELAVTIGRDGQAAAVVRSSQRWWWQPIDARFDVEAFREAPTLDSSVLLLRTLDAKWCYPVAVTAPPEAPTIEWELVDADRNVLRTQLPLQVPLERIRWLVVPDPSVAGFFETQDAAVKAYGQFRSENASWAIFPCPSDDAALRSWIASIETAWTTLDSDPTARVWVDDRARVPGCARADVATDLGARVVIGTVKP